MYLGLRGGKGASLKLCEFELDIAKKCDDERKLQRMIGRERGKRNEQVVYQPEKHIEYKGKGMIRLDGLSKRKGVI